MDNKTLELAIQGVNGNLAGIFEDRLKILGIQKALKSEGVEYGTVFFRESKYMLILCPVVKYSKRKTIYVGSDPEKQRAAYERLDRGDLHAALSSYLAKLDKQILELQHRIDSLERDSQYTAASTREVLRDKKACPGRWERQKEKDEAVEAARLKSAPFTELDRLRAGGR